jgi:hypothetical protein
MPHGKQQNDPALFDSLRLELRRGCLIVAVLAALRTEQYGYTLRKLLAERGLAVDEGTLYPLLRRLETLNVLRTASTSTWSIMRRPGPTDPPRWWSGAAEQQCA